MAAVQPLILLFNFDATGTGAGFTLGVQGDTIALGGQSKALREVPYEINVVLSDGTVPSTAQATVQFQTSPDAVTWTTLFTYTVFNLATSRKVPQDRPRVGSLKTVFCRLNVSAVSGGTTPKLNAYLRLKQ